MKSIEGRAKTVRELLDGARYTIDFYQREYAWQERQVRELIDDLTGKFLDFYQDDQDRHEVEGYGHYFLGSIVISHKNAQRYIVDGQQRLTTLTLLLIYLHHLQAEREDRVDVRKLVYSEKYGTKKFNLDVPERAEMMRRLLEGNAPDTNGEAESVRNLAERYRNLADHFPEEMTEHALPFFVDWLLENVHFVEIEAYSDEDAYTIFETMNDRGLSLSLTEMLKGYVLANIGREDDQRAVNTLWQKHVQALQEVGEEEDTDFFKNWLRARYAETIRPGKKGAENKDYERIGSEFHRWVRDQKEALGLDGSNSWTDFVRRDLDFYARHALAIRLAAHTLSPGWESIRYNEDRGFTLQNQVLLAPLVPSDSTDVVRKKVALVADYLDIWLARRVWNFRTIAYSSVKYTIFTLTKELRERDVPSLSAYLREQLEAQPEVFAGQPRFRLHQQNYRQVRHLLARLTHWVDVNCGLASHFEDLVSQGRARPYEIEHIWANKYDRFADVYSHPSEFDAARNHIGGLLLLQRGLNQSLGDAAYEKKRDAYVSHGQNLLARSLHPLAYQNNPTFSRLLGDTGLQFRACDSLGPEQQAERQELYIRLAEWVWNPSRLDLDGIKAPIPKPIFEPTNERDDPKTRSETDGVRLRFWTRLLDHAKTVSDLHANISPSHQPWISAGRHGHQWNYLVLRDECRVELYIDTQDATENKALFDALFVHLDDVEREFGDELLWQRLDDKRASKVCYAVPGGWSDESTWPRAIEGAVEAMGRFYAALGPRLEIVRQS